MSAIPPPEEQGNLRLYKRRRIFSPNNQANYVDVPILVEAHLYCPQEQFQDFVIYLDNSAQSSRIVHVKRVTNPRDASQYVDVERIEQWLTLTIQEQAQERRFLMSNSDPAPLTFRDDGSVDTSVMHEKVHYVRYFKGNDNAAHSWVDMELIDEIRIFEPQSQYQEWRYTVLHPKLGNVVTGADVPYEVTEGYCDPNLELMPEE